MSLEEVNQLRDHLNSIITAQKYDNDEFARQVIDDLTELDSLELTRDIITQSRLGITIGKLKAKPKNTQIRTLSSNLLDKIQQILKRPTTPVNMQNVKNENKGAEKEKFARHFSKQLKEVYKSEYKHSPDEIADKISEHLEKLDDSASKFAFLINLITDHTKEAEFHFREKLLKGEITPSEFVDLKKDDALTEEDKQKLKKITEENMNKAMAPKPPGFSSKNYRCRKCGKNNVSFIQMQTRSADEPMTTFFTCGDCGYQWKMY